MPDFIPPNGEEFFEGPAASRLGSTRTVKSNKTITLRYNGRTHTWTGDAGDAGDGAMSNPGNWDTGTVPGPGDILVLPNSMINFIYPEDEATLPTIIETPPVLPKPENLL